MFNVMKRTLPLLLAGGVIVSLPATAEAGPPLICHPFDAGASKVLPWGHGEGWNTPDRSYDVRKLTADTLRLLSADAPILARMENMRRATIYAEKNRQVADELLAAVLARTTPNARGVQSPLALFDAGYLIETYRQWNMLTEKKLDGYALAKKALEAGPNPDMEFAASLMKEGSVSADHRRRAEAGAVPGSLLARNLGSHSPMK
jgi:hypothetical protein